MLDETDKHVFEVLRAEDKVFRKVLTETMCVYYGIGKESGKPTAVIYTYSGDAVKYVVFWGVMVKHQFDLMTGTIH